MAKIDSFRLRLINTILIAAYIVSVVFVLFFEVRTRTEELIKSVDNRLLAAASVVKYLLAEDFHDRAVKPGAIGMDEERMNRHRVNTFCRDNGFEWVYTVIEWGGGYYFTAPTVTEIETLERDSWYFYPYEDIPEEFVEAIKSGEPAVLTYSDAWGTHRTVALPEISPRGNPYISCVEYNISSVDSEVRIGVSSSALRFSVIALIVFPFLILNIVYNIRMHVMNSELDVYRLSLEELVDKRTEELKIARDELREQAIRDPLTGIFNRRFMNERLEEEIRRHQRSGGELSVMMIDLDYFKEINDKYGHIAGDRVLKNIALGIKDNLREHDIIGRYGGDEFIIILPDTNIENAGTVGEKLLKIVSDMQQKVSGQRLTLSIGVAEYIPGEDLSEYLSRADFKMYQAKKKRNRVSV